MNRPDTSPLMSTLSSPKRVIYSLKSKSNIVSFIFRFRKTFLVLFEVPLPMFLKVYILCALFYLRFAWNLSDFLETLLFNCTNWTTISDIYLSCSLYNCRLHDLDDLSRLNTITRRVLVHLMPRPSGIVQQKNGILWSISFCTIVSRGHVHVPGIEAYDSFEMSFVITQNKQTNKQTYGWINIYLYLDNRNFHLW